MSDRPPPVPPHLRVEEVKAPPQPEEPGHGVHQRRDELLELWLLKRAANRLLGFLKVGRHRANRLWTQFSRVSWKWVVIALRDSVRDLHLADALRLLRRSWGVLIRVNRFTGQAEYVIPR